jgi:hypothetical protein
MAKAPKIGWVGTRRNGSHKIHLHLVRGALHLCPSARVDSAIDPVIGVTSVRPNPRTRLTLRRAGKFGHDFWRTRGNDGSVNSKYQGALIVGLGAVLTACGSSPNVLRPQAERPAPVSIQIRLNHVIVTAGVPIHGTATVDNSTKKVIAVNACPGQWLLVGLNNSQIPYDPPIATVACQPSIHLPPGKTAIPVTVNTTYDRCAVRGPYTLTLPQCSTSEMPPLPVGSYKTKVVTGGIPPGVVVDQSLVVKLNRPRN